ncbi:ATP-binding cassette domain-containing protein [candidate division KSB1 bacterium]|nr:ATP-binding cassette domain-containing protein [candidate division KSB1 bacterium]
MYAVETFELSKFYSHGRIKALQDFSLQVEKGKIFSLLGPNGAGKTTLIKVLIGIVHQTSGHAKLLNQSINKVSVHKKIGYLAENHRFPEFLSAHQILHYYGKMAGLGPSQLKKQIPALLKTVNLHRWENVKIRKYSKGMMQRLGLAHALLNEPELIFLDEPTDGIDPVGRRQIRDLLKSLRDEGVTIFVNSHLLSEVERMSDEVAILKQGKLIQRGTVEDFISIKEQYQIRLDSADTMQNICNDMKVPIKRENDLFTVSVQDDQQLNRLIDRLRQSKTMILAVIPKKITLEDYFIDIIEDKKGESD